MAKDLLQNVAMAAKDYTCNFGANKNLMRCIPVMIDGLKPGARRLFWSWWISEGRPSNTNKETLKKLTSSKVDTICSAAMMYHPHGTSALEQRLATEGQTWNNNVLTVISTGSFGNIRGDRPSAGRYIEAKMSEYMIDCFFDNFDIYKVPMKDRYDGRAKEPEYLPTKYPHILFNPQFSSIGYSIASNIPSFNVTETLKATISLIKHPEKKIMLYPDIPTGCDIVDTGHFKDIMETGVGKITMKATYEIDYDKNVVRITSLPMQTGSMDVIKKVIDIRNDKKRKMIDQWVDWISDIHDNTKEGTVDLRFILKADANPKKFLEMLFQRKTDLKKTFPVGIKIIDDYAVYDYGVRQLLEEWIEYRRDAIRSKFNNELQQTLEKEHMNNVLIMVSDEKNVHDTINIIQKSANRQESISKLMNKFGITSLQAETINDMKIVNLNREHHKRYKDQKKILADKIKEIRDYIANGDKIDDFIVSQLEEGIKKYGHKRKSRIVKEDEEIIEESKHLIGITRDGFIKKIGYEEGTAIGPIGKGNISMTVMSAMNTSDILMIDTDGNAVRLSVSEVPDMDVKSNGVELVKFMKPGSSPTGELVNIMLFPDFEKDDAKTLVIVTKDGMCKRILASDLSSMKPGTSKSVISLGESGTGVGFDSVVDAVFCSEDELSKDIIISTNKGNGIRLPISDIKIYGRTAKGSRQIILNEGEFVANGSKIDPKQKLIFYITSSGKCKITEMKYLPVRTKRDQTVSLLPIEGKESLVGLAGVNKKDVVMVYLQNQGPETINVSDLKVSTRVAKPTKMIKTPKGERVVAFKVFHYTGK